MAEEKRPGLTVREETDGRLRKLLVDYDGNVLLDETVFAYDDLIHFLDRSVKELRKQIHELKMHKLFEESLDVHVADTVFSAVRSCVSPPCSKTQYHEVQHKAILF